MKGDLDAVSKWKEREIDRIDAETAQAARWGAERFRKNLDALADLDAQGRLAIGGGYLNERSHRAGSVRYSVGSVDGALPTRTPLVAMHFLSSKHLAAAIKRKGLPTPSIAVTRDNATWQLPNSYGDSVLFFKQGTVDPKANPRNLLFPGDAMTQRYPQNAVKKGGLDNIMRTLANMGWEKLDEAEVRKEALILALLQNDRETAEDIETPALFAAWVYGQTGEKLTTPEAVRAYAERFRDAETGAIEPVIETTDTWGGVYQRNFFKDAPRHIVYTGRAPTGAKAAQEAFDATGVKFRPGAYPIDDQSARRNLAYAALFTLGDIENARTAIANATKRPYEDWKQAPMRLLDAVAKDGVPRDVSLRKFINDLAKETTLDGALALFNGENRWYNTTPEARQALLDLVQFYKDAERDYYEAKPQRIVGLGEIALAIIPASEITLRRELENLGIPYETYNASPAHALEETSDVAKNAIARARFNIGGTPVASTPITTKEATEILKAKEDVVFTNAAERVSATIKNRQRNKLVSADARSKSRANGFSDTEHLNAATQAGELFETARLVEDRQGKLDNGSEDPNVRIQRYVAPVTIDRAEAPITATAYLTVKVSTSYRRPKNQSEQTPNRIYSLELLELRDPRLQGQGPTSSDVQPNARKSTDTVAYPGADVNPRREIGGLYSGAPVAYDRPSLKAVGSNNGGRAFGWGLNATDSFYGAKGYAGVTHATLARNIAIGGDPLDELEGPIAAIVRRALQNPDLDVRALSTDTLRTTLERDAELTRRTVAELERSGKNPGFLARQRADLETYAEIARRGVTVAPIHLPAVHEQIWWTHRPEGDESHLLLWDEPLSPENRTRVLEAIDSLGLDPQELSKLENAFGEDWRTREMTGRQAYAIVASVANHGTLADLSRAASELLYRHDIDGVRGALGDFPVYVAFSDEHLRVVRRWVWDPQTQDFALDTTLPAPEPRRSIGGWLEQATEAHLTAEREGDVETAQRLVHEAAERAGYRHKAAHGTGQFGFTVFDPNKSDDKRSLFFAGDPTLAATYQWQATDISGRGSANTAFRDVASTIRPLELDPNAEYPNDAAFIHAVTEAVERAGGTVAVGHLEPGSGKTVKVAPGEYIGMKPWPQDYILVTMPRSDGPKAFDVLTPDTMVREAKALNAAKEGELRGYAARLKAEYEADPNGEYDGAFGRMSKKDRWLQAEHTLKTFLENPKPYLEDDSLTAAQSNAIADISINWEFLRQNDSFGIYHVALRMDNPLVIDAQGGNWSAIDIKLPGSNRKHWKTRQLAEYAQTHGYDGVQINNVYDLGPNYIPGAGRKPSSVYIVFRPEQVKSLDPFTYDDSGNLIPLSQRFDTAQPDIRRSIGGRAPRGVPLTAYHALSQEQLLRSLRQGGLVAPSIAVTEAGKARAFGYGECFLFFRREAVDPQANPENFIFPGDAGTPIYPRRWPTQTSVDAVLRRVRALGPEWTATTREEILREAMRVYNVTNESFEDSGLVDVPNALYALYLAESSDGDITPTPDGTRDIARDLAREDPDGFLRVPDFWRWAKAQFKISTRALTPRQATRLMRLAPLKELSSLSPELGDEMTQFHDSAMLALRDIEETRKVIVHPYNVERGFDALKRAIRKPGVSAENSLRHLSADLSLVNTEAELRDLFSRENEWYATGERALNALLRYIRNASGMEEGSYFEAKPMRLVGIDEIRMALIPQNASAELRTALTESGIPYKTYTEGDRRRAIRDAAAQTRFSIGGNARQKDAHGAYPDLGGVIAAARFSVGAKRKQEYRDLIAKARPNLPQADVDAFMAEMDTLGDTKKEKAALHWFVKGALILPEETKTLGKALQVAEAFKIDPYRTDTPQEVLRIAATMAQDRSRELQGAFLRPEDIGLQLERDCGNGLKIYDVGETQQASVWRLMRSQGFIFVNPKTNKIIANSPWCLLTPTDSGSGPSQSAVAFWEGDPKATEEEINEDPYALGYTGIPKRAAFFRDRIVAFCADLNIDGYDRNRENWFDLNNDRVGQECEFFWEGTAEQMGLTHVPPETPVYVSGDESETEMTVGEEGSDVYEHYHDNELQESIVQPTLFPIAPFAKPRRQVGGNAPFNRADFVARATPIANDPNVKERSAHDFPIGDVPDALVRHGATPGGLLTTDGKIAKMARRHDLPPDRLADAIEAMNDPVAIFLEWEDAARGTIGLSVLTNILADDGEGRQAPVRLTLITRTDAPGMFLTSAYARKRSKEHNYVKVITNGGLLYVDEQRVAQLPLEDATVSACVPSNVRGDPSVGTVPNREEKVKENVRRAIGVESV